jgi:23S rRNA (cytidine1920-2'-O)/16S rRNA (cytidine1409-2'-O)-methyltransferase
MAKDKVRIDVLLVELGLVDSREKGRRLIMAGEVTVSGQMVDKPGTLVSATAPVILKAKPRFVSRGGEKLLGALTAFQLNLTSWVCADIGASTGGFTDCLLQEGAIKVYAIDVGEGILDWKLRTDPRVVVMENTNARYLGPLPEMIRLVTIDASFISLKLLLPVAKSWLMPEGQIVTLIKPQFEAGRDWVGKNGVVRDPQVHQAVLMAVLTFAASINLQVTGLIQSPLLGPAGNVEFLACFSLTDNASSDFQAFIAALFSGEVTP